MYLNREVLSIEDSLANFMANSKTKQRGQLDDTDPKFTYKWIRKLASGDFIVDSASLRYDSTLSTWEYLDKWCKSIYCEEGLSDDNVITPVPIGESGVSGLDASFTATSIVGALNELKTVLADSEWERTAIDYTNDYVSPKITAGVSTFVSTMDGLTDPTATQSIKLSDGLNPELSSDFAGANRTSLYSALNYLRTLTDEEVQKVVVDAPGLTLLSNGYTLCNMTGTVGSSTYKSWVGVCEEDDKLTLTGEATLKVRNFTGSNGVKLAGTYVFCGHSSYYGAGYISTTTNTDADLNLSHPIIGELAEDFDFTDGTTYFEVPIILKAKQHYYIAPSANYTYPSLVNVLSSNLSLVSSLKTLTYNGSNDGGEGTWASTGNTGTPSSINYTLGCFYDSLGKEFKAVPINGRVSSASFGIVPDGVTDWWNISGSPLSGFLTYLSNNEVTGVFTAGFYATKLDNFNSNVSIYFEPNAIFSGTIHVAINPSITNPTLSRPENVRFYGEVSTYGRVGTYNCDDVYIEYAKCYDDQSKSLDDVRGGGIHIYSGSKDVTIDNVYVENSTTGSAVGIDYDVGVSGHTTPSNINIKHINILNSYVSGMNLVGENILIGDVILGTYGSAANDGSYDSFTSWGLPGNVASTAYYCYGVTADNCSNVKINSLKITQNPSYTPANTKCGYDAIFISDLGVTIDNIDIYGSTRFGIYLNTSSSLRTNYAKVSYSEGYGIGCYPSSRLDAGSMDISYNALGLYANQSVVKASNIESSYNDSYGVYFTAGCELNIGSIRTYLNCQVSTTHYNSYVKTSKGYIGSSSSYNPGVGGHYFEGDCTGLTYGRIEGIYDSISAQSQLYFNGAQNISFLSGVLSGNGYTWIAVYFTGGCKYLRFNNIDISGTYAVSDIVYAAGGTTFEYCACINCRIKSGAGTSNVNLVNDEFDGLSTNWLAPV